MKLIDLMCCSTPTEPEFGWGDYVAVYNCTTIIWKSPGSCCPNPYQVSRYRSAVPWNLCYGWIADGEYDWECIDKHRKFGKCLLIEGGGPVPSRTPNTKHGGDKMLVELFVHCGSLKSKRQDWRGSAGCPTIPPQVWPDFIALFSVGEHGKLRVRPKVDLHIENTLRNP